jgi:L-amino acid N-acyltransferase
MWFCPSKLDVVLPQQKLCDSVQVESHILLMVGGKDYPRLVMNHLAHDRSLSSVPNLMRSTPANNGLVNLAVRPATYDDLPAILTIYNEAVLHTTASYDYYPTTLEARAAWFESHAQNRLPVFVAELEPKQIVGWSALNSFRHADGYRCTAENSIYVAAEQRGRGIGKLLLAPLIEAGQQLELHSLIAGIDAANMASIRLHAAFGFEQVGYLKQVAFKFDRWLDLILMQRLL